MPIPDYQSIMLPLLSTLSDGRERSVQDLTEDLALRFKLDEQARSQLLPSGRQPVFRNRVGWAKSYLSKAGLLSGPKRGWVRITELGQKVIAEKPARIDVPYLERFDSFVAFRNLRHEDTSGDDGASERRTPQEELEDAHKRIQAELQEEMLEQIKLVSPRFFERLVLDLIVRLGYGGDFRDAAQAVGRGKDGGIDGIIKEDKLGLDTIYLQAKRWANPVGRPEIQKFAGALQGRRARKGVFITTSSFTEEAEEFARGIDKIVLIDGPEVARLMIEYDLGVSRVESYDVKKIDSDYFAEV